MSLRGGDARERFDHRVEDRCYTTQLGFQFGGPEHVEPRLRELAAAEAARVGAAKPCETLTGAALPLASTADTDMHL